MPAEQRVRDDPALLTVLVAFLVLRLAAVIGQSAIVYADSGDYEHLDFWGGRRPWATPLLYELVEAHASRVFVQALLSAVAFGFLAVQAGRLVEHRVARWAVVLGLLGLSLTTSVTNWDATLLSESLALSSGALLLGTFLRFWRVPTLPSAAAVVATWLFWIFTRQAHLILGALTTLAVAGVLVVVSRRDRRVHRALAALVAGLAVVTVLAAWSYQQDTDIAHLNLAEVLGRRVFRDADDVAWLHDHGMPVPDNVVPGEPVEPNVLLEHPAFARWIDEDGMGTYARFLLVHPWFTLTRPLDALVSDRPPFADPQRSDDVLLAMPDDYGVGRAVLPEPVEDLLFKPGAAGTVVFATVVALAATMAVAAAGGADRRWTVPLLTLLLQWPALILVWHTSTVELGRLGLPSAVLLRAALILQLGLLADAWVAPRPAPAAPAPQP